MGSWLCESQLLVLCQGHNGGLLHTLGTPLHHDPLPLCVFVYFLLNNSGESHGFHFYSMLMLPFQFNLFWP